MKIDNKILAGLKGDLVLRCSAATSSITPSPNTNNFTIVSPLRIRLALADLKSIIIELEEEFKRESN